MSGWRVVKIGGSLSGSAELARWLRRLADGRGWLIVPGGGPFADEVRRRQPVLGYGQEAAHGMAILAMQQMALAFHALESRLRPAERIEGQPGAGATVWLPWAMVGRCREIEASWDVTSDSLALWLAREVGAVSVTLVKSAPVPAAAMRAEEAARLELVDAAFQGFAQRFQGTINLVGKGWDGELDRLAADGCRIVKDRAAPLPAPGGPRDRSSRRG